MGGPGANAEPSVRHLLKGLGPGGAERLVVAQVAAANDPSRHDVVYLVPQKRHLAPLVEAAGASTACLDGPRLARPGWIIRLRRRLLDAPTDVLHVHSPAVAAVARVLVRTLPRSRRPRLVGTEHNRWPRHHRVTRWANRATIRLQDATIAVSDDVKSTVSGIAADRVHVVVHGIDTGAVRAAADRAGVRDELGVTPADIVVMCVANLRREKALPVLIEAAAAALEREPNLRFFLVGQGPLAAEIDSEIDHHAIAARFTALGYRDDVPRLLSGADLFTLSSTHEGLPVAVMEALTHGLPIVATDAGGIAAAAGPAGRISAIGDAGALSANYVALAADPDQRSQLTAAALRQADRFSIERAAAELNSLYRS